VQEPEQEQELKDDDMDKIIEEYEKQHGKINMNMCCNNKQDRDVWDALPLTDNQKKYVILNILGADI
jgi:hypothetical protein